MYKYVCMYVYTTYEVSTKLGAVPQINPRFGINTLPNLHVHSLHIICLRSLLKRLIVFLRLNSSGKIVHNWGAW